MKKLVISYGNSLVIRFDPEDQKIFNIEEGDVIDFGFKVIKKEVKSKR